MDLCWESQQRIRELAAQIDGRSDWERAKKIADLLNQDLQLYPPARRGRKWTQEGVTRYLKKLPHEPSSKKGASRIEPVWVKGSVPRGFWRNPTHRFEYMEWLGNKLSYQKAEDWYDVCTADFCNNFGGGLLRHYYDNSIIKALREYMPEMEWDEWRVGGHVPNSTWKSPDMRRKYMTHLGSKKGFKSPEDWYALSTADFYQNYGSGLLHEYYGGSPLKALQEYMPGYSWLPWRFAYTAKNVFQEKTNRIQAVKWLLEEVLGLMDLEEFYQLRQEHLVEHLNGITPYCGGSPLQLLRECYPDYEWLEWKFGCTPHGFWDKAENRLAYLDWLGKRLGFREPDDWYLLTAEDINRNYGSGLFTYYDGSPANIVMSNIDNPQGWDQARFSAKLPWRRQRHLYEVILKLFPDKKEWIIYNYHHPDLRFADSGRSMQLDIFIPPDLAIEYQGEPHFFAGRQDMFGGEAGFSSLQIRDEEKRQACKEEGIKLIEITYEWDGSVEQIVEALKNHGVFPTGATPI